MNIPMTHSEYEERVMNIAPTPAFQRAFKRVTGLECSPQNVINTVQRVSGPVACRSGRCTPTLSGSPGNAGSSPNSSSASRSASQTSSKRRQSDERDSETRIDDRTDGWDDTAAEAEARLIRGSLLKFADWKWSIGKEAIEVKEGTPTCRCRHRCRLGEMAGEQAGRISPAGSRAALIAGSRGAWRQ